MNEVVASPLTPVPLFDFEEEELLTRKLENSMDADRVFIVIDELEKEVENVKTDAGNARFYYSKRKEKIEARIEWYKAQLQSFFKATGRKNIATPNGNAKLTSATSRDWGDEDAAIEWLKENGLQEYVETEESIDKVGLLKHIKKTGEVPPGFKEEKREIVAVSCTRQVTKEATDEDCSSLAA